MLIYKCADCGAVSYAENNFKCPICGEQTIGFKRPSISEKPGIDFKAVAWWAGVGALVLCLMTVIFLGCLM